MKSKIFNYLTFLSLFAFSCLLNAQVKFEASVPRNEVSAGERFQVQYTLYNTQGKDFKAPSFKGFSMLSGPSQSQSTQWINGKVTSSVSYIYLLQADVAGKFTIEPASITADGKRLTSNSLTITVVKGAVQPKQSDDEKNVGKQADDIIRKNIFIRLSTSKQTAYEGEAIVATYKLYVHPQLQTNLNQPKMPTFNGFWTQDLDIKKLEFKREVVDGVAYNVAEVKKVVLLPQQSGNLTIDPMELEATVRIPVQQKKQQRRSPFDDFFDDPFFNNSYKDFPTTIKSKSSTINIKQLPENAPATFHGAVGELQMKAWLDKTSCKTNDAVTLKVQISGMGNLKLIEPLSLTLPPDIDSYEPKTQDNVSVSASGMNGNKTFEYYLIPRNPGEFKIEPIKFSYFDLSSKKYITLVSNEFTLRVEKGSGDASTVITGLKKEDVKLIGKDILFIKAASRDFSKSGSGFFGSALYYFALVSPMFFFIFVFIYNRRQEKLSGNQALLRNKKANSVAKKRLTEVRKYLQNNDEEKFYEEISKALWFYLSDKLVIPLAELNKENAKIILEKKKMPEILINKLDETIDYCEFARFAPMNEKLPLQKVYNDAASVITELEGYLK